MDFMSIDAVWAVLAIYVKKPLFESTLVNVDTWVLKTSPWIFAIVVTFIQFKMSKKANKELGNVAI